MKRMELACRVITLLIIGLLHCGAQTQGQETVALLKIAREYRDGKDGAMKSPLRAARFYELLIERSSSLSTDDKTVIVNLREAEMELAELLEADPTLSTRYSYLGLLIQSAGRGHADAQHKLSVAYGTGIAARDLVPMDAGRSLFLEYVSALSGNAMANLGMGYRFSMGIGVTESCEAALPHYQYAADISAESIQVFGVQGRQPDTLKLSEANDPSGRMSRRDGTLELADYYAHLAEQGDALAAVTLGNMLLSGSRHMPFNETLALHYLGLAADAQNPAGAGLQGYVLLNQFLSDVQRMTALEGIEAARSYAQSQEGMLRADRFLKLLQLAQRKGDVHGAVGAGVAHFHGVGFRANFTKALDLLERAAGAHPDAGFYIGEICMGLASMELSGGDGEPSPRGRFKRHEVTTAEEGVRGGTPAEVRAREGKAVSHAIQNREIDPAAAARAYTVSAQLGHLLSQHRLAHINKRGLAGPANCKETVKLFKTVAERGPWMDSLALAHKHYADGNEMAALHLFAQLAAVGVESAQYNAAYILSRCTRCPPMNKAASQGVIVNTGTGKIAGDTSTSTDPLEKQHRSLKHSTETDFRALLKLHDAHEAAVAAAVEARAASERQQEEEDRRPKVVTNREHTTQSVVDSNKGAEPTAALRSAAFLPVAAWREFLEQYHPDSLVDALDIEFSAAVTEKAAAQVKADRDAARKVGCETRALTLFDLSAQQGNSEAFMQLGDFYYYQRAGLLHEERKREAAEFYQQAADLHHTQAIFNLGIMHEAGDGVIQDLHLAKRYYDQAAEVDTKARVPRDLALMVLEGHKTFNAVFGVQAASQLLGTSIPLPVSWTELRFRSYTLWELLELGVALERRLHRRIDALVLWYCEYVLQPSRDVMDVFRGAPLSLPFRFTGSDGAARGFKNVELRTQGHGGTTPQQAEQMTLGDCWRLVTSAPDACRELYDRAFEVAFRLLHYVVRGEMPPPLSVQHDNYVEVTLLREELLLVVLLGLLFLVVLAFRWLRRKLLEAQRDELERRGQRA